MELSIRCKDGTERIVVVSAAPLEDAFAGTHLIVLQDVTVRRLSENKLRESEARLHTLFEFSPYGILDEDFSAVRAHFDHLRASGVKDFRAHFSAHPDEVTHCALLVKVRDVNNQALRILEAPTKAEILTDISSYFDATAVSVFREELITLAEGRTFFATDMPLRLPSGKNRVCALRLCVVPGSEQSLNQVLVTFEDVTDRRQHEQAQRESAMQLSLVIRGGGIGFWDWNFVSGSLSVNDRWMAILGLDPQGPLPTMDLWHSLVHPDDMPKLVQLIELVILNPDGADGEVEIRARHAAGHYVWILDKFNVVERSADGSPLRVVGTHLDITARKAAELELRESRERFLQLAENIQEVFWISDVAKNHLVYVSPAYETIWGRTCERLYQDPRSWMEAIHPEDRPRIAHAAQTKQALGLYNETYRILRPDGVVRWIHDKAFPVKESTGEIRRIVGTAEDITSRVVLEEQVRQSQKLQTIGTLAAGIAHDFNNILAAIIGNNELAMAEVAPENPAHASLDEIRKASARGKGLVQQILAFSSQHPMERRSMALGPVVLEVTKLLRATIPAIVQIDTSVDPNAPPVLADATQIHQILVNLCTNAWHALGDRPGCIEVSLRSITLNAEAAGRIAGLQPGRFACLCVRDNGKGMDPDTLNRIFDPFFTTKGPGKGTGLGLSVVHGIVRGYQGAIQVVSQPGAGTTFTVYFPASVSAPAATAPVTPAASYNRDPSRHILYLDDDESLLFAATRILKRLGYRVTGFVRPADAMRAFLEKPSQFDLAVTDMNMPEVTGLAVARDLLKVRSDFPIVLVSGNIDEELRDAARAAGICGIVCKPFTIDEISEAIRRLPSNQRQP
jgi:PAS domain S-box-containing protein